MTVTIIDHDVRDPQKQWRPVKLGTVKDHTLLVMKKMAALMKGRADLSEQQRFMLMMVALLHDIGKPTAGRKNGCKPERTWPDVHDHDAVGAPLAKEWAAKLGLTLAEQDQLYRMTLLHMQMHKLGQMKSLYKVLKITTQDCFKELCLLAKADSEGCIKTTADDEEMDIDEALMTPLVKKALTYKKLPPRIVRGDDLIEAGLKPGPAFAFRLEVAHKLQVDKGITDKAQLLKQALAAELPASLKKKEVKRK